MARTFASLALALGTPQHAIAPTERGLHILGASTVELKRLAELRFTLARALWESGRDRERALALAKQAAAGVDVKVAPKARENIEEWIRNAEAEQVSASDSSGARTPH